MSSSTDALVRHPAFRGLSSPRPFAPGSGVAAALQIVRRMPEHFVQNSRMVKNLTSITRTSQIMTTEVTVAITEKICAAGKYPQPEDENELNGVRPCARWRASSVLLSFHAVFVSISRRSYLCTSFVTPAGVATEYDQRHDAPRWTLVRSFILRA